MESGGVWTGLLTLGREGEMKWRVMVELGAADGTVHLHEVSIGECTVAACSAETLGLSIADGKTTLAGLQRQLVQAQTEEHCWSRRRCLHCGAQRPLKDFRRRRLTSLFGDVEVRAPRFGPCRCGVASRRTITPVAEIMPDRCTPEYERTVAKMGASLPYRRARSLLGDFFPLGDAPEVETVRQRTLHVGARLERQAVAPRVSAPPPEETDTITLAIDGGHVNAVRSYQVRSFEVFVAQVSNDAGKQVVFSSMPAEADRQVEQLRNVLHDLGATKTTPVTILSDGAGGPRNLGEAASIGPTEHVLDWFHLAMRIQHVAQAAKSWPANTPAKRREGARLSDTIEHIHWRLWHGQVQRALDLIGETLVILEATATTTSPEATAAGKAAVVLAGLETYVAGQSDLIIDYATARGSEEPISTATTESTVQWLLHRRMGANQQMRWSPRGAHLMLKVRTSVVNGNFDKECRIAERWARRPFQNAA